MPREIIKVKRGENEEEIVNLVMVGRKEQNKKKETEQLIQSTEPDHFPKTFTINC